MRADVLHTRSRVLRNCHCFIRPRKISKYSTYLSHPSGIRAATSIQESSRMRGGCGKIGKLPAFRIRSGVDIPWHETGCHQVFTNGCAGFMFYLSGSRASRKLQSSPFPKLTVVNQGVNLVARNFRCAGCPINHEKAFIMEMET